MTARKTAFVAIALLSSGLAQAQLSANVGWASEYHFRGILQKVSSASAGLDYESGGFYVGTWAADVDNGVDSDGNPVDGLEVDVYFGYGGEVEDFGYSVGFTGYYYTGDFDDTYQEINLGGSYGPLSLDVAIGEYDNFTGPTQDYTFAALTLAAENGLYGTYGTFSQDADGDYLELGYGTTVAEIDVGIALIFANDDLIGNDDESLIFSLGKSFDLQ
ncbi:MAG: TorF family putative porin [Gammaproteobacteria bacterium]|nr:TorF family putative porin [Gammaproteobacteria bacterium]